MNVWIQFNAAFIKWMIKLVKLKRTVGNWIDLLDNILMVVVCERQMECARTIFINFKVKRDNVNWNVPKQDKFYLSIVFHLISRNTMKNIRKMMILDINYPLLHIDLPKSHTEWRAFSLNSIRFILHVFSFQYLTLFRRSLMNGIEWSSIQA